MSVVNLHPFCRPLRVPVRVRDELDLHLLRKWIFSSEGAAHRVQMHWWRHPIANAVPGSNDLLQFYLNVPLFDPQATSGSSYYVYDIPNAAETTIEDITSFEIWDDLDQVKELNFQYIQK